MKILLVTSYFLHPSANGGAVMGRTLAIGLRARGFDLSVVCVDTGAERGEVPRIRTLTQDGVPVTAVLPRQRHPGRTKPLWRLRDDEDVRGMAWDLLQRDRPDLLYAQSAGQVAGFISVAADLGIPVVYHVHDFCLLCARVFLVHGRGFPCDGPTSTGKCFSCLQTDGHVVRRIARRLACRPAFFRLAATLVGPERAESLRLGEAVEEFREHSKGLRECIDRFIVTSSSIADVFQRCGAAAHKMRLLPHFVPRSRVFPPRLTVGTPPRIAFFGRIALEKGFDHLIDALAMLDHKSRPCEFHVIAANANNVTRANISRRTGMSTEDVYLHAGLSGRDVDPVLREMDLCVIPSVCREIGPLTLIEAMAQGVPCVVSDSAGLAGLVTTDVNGVVYAAAHTRALGEALGHILNTPSVLVDWRRKLPMLPTEEDYFRKLSAILSEGRG